jgi:arsenate reductase
VYHNWYESCRIGRNRIFLFELMITLYGIPNCDTVRKARNWLKTHGVDYIFFDMRKDGLTREVVNSWIGQVGWEQIVNKRGTNWKKLSPKAREALNEKSVTRLVLETPTLVKRPVIDFDGKIIVGFDEKTYKQFL